MANKLFILCFLLIACNPIKKAERTILNNKDASERIFRALEPLHPCANDTMIITKVDTTITTDTIIDYKRDTLNHIITLTEKGKIVVKTIYIDKIHTGYIVDTRRLDIALDSVQFYKALSQVNKDTSKAWSRRFWVLLCALIIIGFIKYKL